MGNFAAEAGQSVLGKDRRAAAEVAAFLYPRNMPDGTVIWTSPSGLTMPRRTITRAQARKQRINDERRLNEEQLAHPTGQVAAASRNTTADRWSTGSP